MRRCGSGRSSCSSDASTRARGSTSCAGRSRAIASDEPDAHLLVTATPDQLPEATLSDRIHCIGVVDDARKLALHRAADVVCCASTAGESFGMVVLEGLAGGSAVIASDIPGFRYAGGDVATYVAARRRRRVGGRARATARGRRPSANASPRGGRTTRASSIGRASPSRRVHVYERALGTSLMDLLLEIARPCARPCCRTSAPTRTGAAEGVVRRRRPDVRHRRDRRGRREQGARGGGRRRPRLVHGGPRPRRARRPEAAARRSIRSTGRVRPAPDSKPAWCRSPPRRTSRDATLGDVDEALVLGIKDGTLFRAREGRGRAHRRPRRDARAGAVWTDVARRRLLDLRPPRTSDRAVRDRARGADRRQRREGRDVRPRLGDVRHVRRVTGRLRRVRRPRASA